MCSLLRWSILIIAKAQHRCADGHPHVAHADRQSYLAHDSLQCTLDAAHTTARLFAAGLAEALAKGFATEARTCWVLVIIVEDITNFTGFAGGSS